MPSICAVWPGFISLVTGKRKRRGIAPVQPARSSLDPDCCLRPTVVQPYAYVIAKINGWISDTANAIAEVKRLAQRAVELGKDDAIALAAGGNALAFVVRDLGVGAGLIDRALVLNSNLAEAWNFGGWVKIWLGRAGKRRSSASHVPCA